MRNPSSKAMYQVCQPSEARKSAQARDWKTWPFAEVTVCASQSSSSSAVARWARTGSSLVAGSIGASAASVSERLASASPPSTEGRPCGGGSSPDSPATASVTTGSRGPESRQGVGHQPHDEAQLRESQSSRHDEVDQATSAAAHRKLEQGSNRRRQPAEARVDRAEDRRRDEAAQEAGRGGRQADADDRPGIEARDPPAQEDRQDDGLGRRPDGDAERYAGQAPAQEPNREHSDGDVEDH